MSVYKTGTTNIIEATQAQTAKKSNECLFIFIQLWPSIKLILAFNTYKLK